MIMIVNKRRWRWRRQRTDTWTLNNLLFMLGIYSKQATTGRFIRKWNDLFLFSVWFLGVHFHFSPMTVRCVFNFTNNIGLIKIVCVCIKYNVRFRLRAHCGTAKMTNEMCVELFYERCRTIRHTAHTPSSIHPSVAFAAFSSQYDFSPAIEPRLSHWICSGPSKNLWANKIYRKTIRKEFVRLRLRQTVI